MELNERPRVIPVVEAGAMLGLSRSATYRAVRNGTFPVPVHDLGYMMVARVELERYLAGVELPPPPVDENGRAVLSVVRDDEPRQQ